MTDKVKKIFSCSPLKCFSVFLVIVCCLFGSIKKDLSEFRAETREDLKAVNSALLTHIQTAKLAQGAIVAARVSENLDRRF